MTVRTIIVLGGTLGLLAVVAGTFGAHGLEGRVTEHQLAIFDTAQRYHMYHALALLACAALGAHQRPGKWLGVAAGCFAGGIVLFSGSLYTLALTGIDALGMIAPIGGSLFIVGWAMLVVVALARRDADQSAT